MDAQAFPDGVLEGAVLHWALAARPGAAWQPAPPGWASDPAASAEAGTPRHPAVGVCQTLPERCDMSPRLLCCTGCARWTLPDEPQLLGPRWQAVSVHMRRAVPWSTTHSGGTAGGGATQTPLERVAVPGCDARPDIAVWAVTLQVLHPFKRQCPVLHA